MAASNRGAGTSRPGSLPKESEAAIAQTHGKRHHVAIAMAPACTHAALDRPRPRGGRLSAGRERRKHSCSVVPGSMLPRRAAPSVLTYSLCTVGAARPDAPRPSAIPEADPLAIRFDLRCQSPAGSSANTNPKNRGVPFYSSNFRMQGLQGFSLRQDAGLQRRRPPAGSILRCRRATHVEVRIAHACHAHAVSGKEPEHAPPRAFSWPAFAPH